MKKQILFSMLVCSAALLVAQSPPPAPQPAASNNITGKISQFNYGAEGRVEGFLIAPNTIVNLPPDWAIQVEMAAKVGDQAKITGTTRVMASGMQLVEPQSIEVAGKRLTMTIPSQPAPYAGSGVIRSLNYGKQGEVNGFVLQNGVIARTPAFGVMDASVLKPGATISVSGFAHATATGKTVVQVQSITANGQTIAMNAVPPPGPGRAPRGRKGPRDAGPPAPPSPPPGAAPGAPGAPPPPPPIQ